MTWTLSTSLQAIRTLELNAGCGGMSEGFRRAELAVTWAVDWDADACASYSANLPGHQVLKRDIRELALGNWSTHVDLLVADTPCQPYSSAGLGLGTDDERDLLGVTVDLVVKIRPSMCLISNVPGLTYQKHANALLDMLERLGSAGYCVDFHMMNGADIGLPQIRKRPWWFGHLGGKCLSWPAQTHWRPKQADLLRPTWRTIGDAFIDEFGQNVQLDELGYHAPIRWKEATDHRPGQWSKPARTLTLNPNGDGSLLDIHKYVVSKKHMPSCLNAPSRTITKRVSEQMLVLTGRARDVVVLNERARLVLQGFPADWTIVGKTKRSRDSQIGLAMPPLMAEMVGRSIVDRERSQRIQLMNQ